MLHYLFRLKELDNLFILKNNSFTNSWQSVYKKYLAHHHNYLLDLLRMYHQKLNDKLDIESLKQSGIDNMKYKELLDMQKPHHNGFQVEMKSDLR